MGSSACCMPTIVADIYDTVTLEMKEQRTGEANTENAPELEDCWDSAVPKRLYSFSGKIVLIACLNEGEDRASTPSLFPLRLLPIPES